MLTRHIHSSFQIIEAHRDTVTEIDKTGEEEQTNKLNAGLLELQALESPDATVILLFYFFVIINNNNNK